jgi:hypothetical protein
MRMDRGGRKREEGGGDQGGKGRGRGNEISYKSNTTIAGATYTQEEEAEYIAWKEKREGRKDMSMRKKTFRGFYGRPKLNL